MPCGRERYDCLHFSKIVLENDRLGRFLGNDTARGERLKFREYKQEIREKHCNSRTSMFLINVAKRMFGLYESILQKNRK